jgi:hypothetical protein
MCTNAAREPDHSIAVRVVIGLVIVLGELAHRAVSLGDRLGQHGEQFGGRRGGQLQRLKGIDGGGAGLGAARSLAAVGDSQQPLARVVRVFVTARTAG